jgi:hypothetical protein
LLRVCNALPPHDARYARLSPRQAGTQSPPPAALRGNNGSAFFSRLPLRAKSAMAEILVSDLCDLSPAAHRRFFSLPRGARSPWCIVFGSVSACFSRCSLLFRLDCFFLAITRSYIVFLRIFALYIACIFVGESSPVFAGAPKSHLARNLHPPCEAGKHRGALGRSRLIAPLPFGKRGTRAADAPDQCASGSGRSWKCTAIGFMPLPPSCSHGTRSPLLAHNPRPFQPAFGSSMRPSRPLA